jgi:dodecin
MRARAGETSRIEAHGKDTNMADDQGRTYRIVELVGTSPDSIEAAIENGIASASEAVDTLDWFEVREVRGRIENAQVAWYQVKMGLGYRVTSPEHTV